MRSHYIVDSAATLLGVALVVVTAVHITGNAQRWVADEISFAAALLFLASCAASHRAISKSNDSYEKIADRIFATGLVVLLAAVVSFWF
jgi:hypothetical protein